MFGAKDVVPADNVLSDYYNDGDVCVCIFIPADLACNDIVLTGSFNNWSTTNCPAFGSIEGYDGWYVASFEPEAEPDENKGMQAMPVILSNSGAFDRKYQAGAVTAIRGGVEVQQGAVAGEIELIRYGADAPNVFTIEAWKNNPCTEAPTVTYTLQLVADPEKGSVEVTNLLGSDIIDNGNGNYTVPANAEVTILATPLEGYEFSGWKVGNRWCDFTECGTALNTLDNPLTITMTEDVAYKAEFAAAAPQETVVTITEADYVSGNTITKDGVTLTVKEITGVGSWYVEGPGTFTNTIGNFTNIEVTTVVGILYIEGDGWTGDSKKMTWTGNAPTVSFENDIFGKGDGFSIVCTIGPAGEEGIENVQSNKAQGTKFFRDGMLFIERNGRIYDATGVQVR